MEEKFRDSISTINKEGKRSWIYPKKPVGRFYDYRKWVSYFLLTFLLLAPFVKINGQQFLLFNVLERRFSIFSFPFWPQDFHLFVISMIIGVVFVPVFGDLYFSTLENGAFLTSVNLNNIDINLLNSNALKLPFKRKDPTFTIVASRSHMSFETENYVNEMRNIHGDVNLISKGSSLKLCMVANGSADCYPRFAPTMEWDTGAAQIIVEEAGGSVVQYKTNVPLIYNKEDLLNPFFEVNP